MATSKRSYGESFDTHHLDARLQHGARPAEEAYHGSSVSYQDSIAEENDFDISAAMSYRRADGTERRRVVPLGD